MNDEAEPRAMTAEEIRDEFLDTCRALADFWANEVQDKPCAERIQGALHSWLVLIDGMTAMHGFDLVAAPHPDDKEFLRGEGENWAEPGTVINGDVMLHDLLYERAWAKYKVTQ